MKSVKVTNTGGPEALELENITLDKPIEGEGRVKKMKGYLDHILLLFDFEKKYFDEENIKNTFVGHPLIEYNEDNKKIIENIIPKNKKIISIFPGSRKSETDSLLNILIDFIKLMNKKHNNFYFYFHATDENKNLILKT